MQPTGPTPVQATNSNTTKTPQSTTLLNQVQVLTPSFSKDGTLSITLPNGQVLSQNIGAGIAQQLNQQLFAVIQNQVTQLFLPQGVTSHAVQLNATLVTALRNWLKTGSDKSFESLPEGIKTLLIAAIPNQKSRFRFFSLSLIGQTLHFTGTDESPILQLQSTTAERTAENKTLISLLQLSIPIALDADDSSVWVEQEDTTKEDLETALSFKMRFDLADLGVLTVMVKLQDFELSITSQSSTQRLFRKNTEVWPLMQRRLEDLGFNVAIQNKLEEKKSLVKDRLVKSHHLLDVKA